MSEAISIHTTPRRFLLALAPCALAGFGSVAAAKKVHSRDAELIRVCQQFAEAEFEGWYAYVTTNDRKVEGRYEDVAPDWATLHRIEAMPAHTPEGWRAKALACAAWDRDAYDCPPDGCESHTALLASLLRDLAAPGRAAIMGRLAAKFGPLPAGYSADGMWIGRAAA